MTNDQRMPKLEIRSAGKNKEPFSIRYSDFGLRISFRFRHSNFGFFPVICLRLSFYWLRRGGRHPANINQAPFTQIDQLHGARHNAQRQPGRPGRRRAEFALIALPQELTDYHAEIWADRPALGERTAEFRCGELFGWHGECRQEVATQDL